MTAELFIERAPQGWTDRFRSYEIFVSGELQDELRRGEQVAIEVDPGPIELWLKIDWCRSRSLRFDLEAGNEVRVHCRPRQVLTALYAVAFARNDYMQLEAR
jgi:hypothetical protein